MTTKIRTVADDIIDEILDDIYSRPELKTAWQTISEDKRRKIIIKWRGLMQSGLNTVGMFS